MKTEFNYPLKVPFDYITKLGDKEQATFITVSAPTAKSVSMIAPLKQAMTMASLGMQERYKDQEVVEVSDDGEGLDSLDGESIVAMIEASGADMEKLVLHFSELFTKSKLFTVEGEGDVRLTSPLIDLMSINDFYGLAGEFLKNFIIASPTD